MKSAVVAGHLCLDILPHIERTFTFSPGQLYEVGAPLIGTGGAVSNTGLAFQILGIPVILMGKVGDDSFGHSVREVIRSRGEGMDSGMVVVPGEVTSYTVVINIPGVDRMFLHCPGANENFVADDVDYDKIKDAALFHFGYPAYMAATYANDGEELTAMYRRVKELGLTTSLDLGIIEPGAASGQVNWPRVFERALPHVDIFLPSADELLCAVQRERFGEGDNLTGTDLSPLGERLLDMGVAVVGIKMGSRGLYLRTGSAERLRNAGAGRPEDCENWAGRELWFPVYEVDNFVGATGAGDTTIAGFLAALLRANDIETSGRMANAVGACSVEAAGPLNGVRSWNDTVSRLNAGWPQADLALTDAGWRRDDQIGIWRGPNDG